MVARWSQDGGFILDFFVKKANEETDDVQLWLHAGCRMEEYWAGGKGGYSRPHVSKRKSRQLPPPTSLPEIHIFHI